MTVSMHSKKVRLVAILVASVAVVSTCIATVAALRMLQRTCNHSYSLLNPLRRCGATELLPEYGNFRDALAARMSIDPRTQDIAVALSFIDLVHGRSFGIHSDATLLPDSLSRMPVMLALLHRAETEPTILTTRIGLEKTPPVKPSIDPSNTDRTLTIGEGYAVSEVLRRSIAYGDTYSDFLLRTFLVQHSGSPDVILSTFRTMGLLSPSATTLTLSVEQYASLFRILYNRQFLSAPLSEYALSLLSENAYRMGIPSLLPNDVTVARMSGILTAKDGARSIVQLHDCGIVYHPRTPYVLCIVTHGNNIPAQASLIEELSSAIYAEVDARSSMDMHDITSSSAATLTP